MQEKTKIGSLVKGRVVAINPSKEGDWTVESLQVELGNGTTGIIPITELDAETNKDSARHIARRYMGRTLLGKVIQIEPFILSMAQAVKERSQNINLEVDQEIEGIVVWVNRKTAALEYRNCITMMLPSENYGYLRIGNFMDVLKAGDKLQLEIKSINPEGVITVSHKKFANDPWDRIKAKYLINGQYLGKVTKKIPAGIFVNLEPELDVLATPYPFFEVNEGDEVALEITDIEVALGKMKGRITALAMPRMGRRPDIKTQSQK
jgi:ribosomal protein S1